VPGDQLNVPHPGGSDDETEGSGLRSISKMAEKTMRQVERMESFDKTKGYLLRQFWYFCDDTSLHGWSYIPRFSLAGSLGWLHRILWFLLVLSSVCFAWYNVWNLFKEYYFEQTPVITTSTTTGSLNEVYFPSVTVCNLNQIRMSQAYRMGFQDIARSAAVSRLFIQKHFLAATGEDQDHKRQLRAAMEMEGRWEVEFAKIKANLTANGIKWNDTSQPFITVDGTAQNCSDLMIHTKWNRVDRYSYSSHVTYTDFGYCCRIYPKLELEEPSMLAPANDTDWVLPQYRKNFSAEYESRRGSKNGIENGLMLLMDVETFENAHYLRKADGLIVALSGNLERPLVGQNGVFVEPGSANLISFSVFGTNTTDNALEKYLPDVDGNSNGGTRTCYADNNNKIELNAKYFNKEKYFKYSMSNCLYSAMVGAIEKKCKCSPIFKRRENQDFWMESGGLDYCMGDQFGCMENLTRSWGSSEDDLNKAEDTRGGPKKICHENCDNQDLRVATSRSGYPKKRTLPLTEDFCLIVSKMRNVCKKKFRKKAFEEHYRHETPLPHGAKLNCRIIEDVRLNKHCQLKEGMDTLYSPEAGENALVKAAEDKLEEAVARYAEDNLLVARVFLKDPYYQKMTRDRTMSGNSFFGAAGGWLGLCCGLSVISMLEIGYHGILFIIAICKGREMSHLNYES